MASRCRICTAITLPAVEDRRGSGRTAGAGAGAGAGTYLPALRESLPCRGIMFQDAALPLKNTSSRCLEKRAAIVMSKSTCHLLHSANRLSTCRGELGATMHDAHGAEKRLAASAAHRSAARPTFGKDPNDPDFWLRRLTGMLSYPVLGLHTYPTSARLAKGPSVSGRRVTEQNQAGFWRQSRLLDPGGKDRTAAHAVTPFTSSPKRKVGGKLDRPGKH